MSDSAEKRLKTLVMCLAARGISQKTVVLQNDCFHLGFGIRPFINRCLRQQVYIYIHILYIHRRFRCQFSLTPVH